MKSIILKAGREKTVLRRHPWIYSGAVADRTGALEPGDVVAVLNSKREFLGWADYSPHSQIVARIWSWDEAEKVDETLLKQRMASSISRRKMITSILTGMAGNAIRLIYAESDGLPGLIVDRYADFLVVQILTMGMERWRHAIVDGLREITGLSQIYERSDVEVRKLEGLEPRKGVLLGTEPTGYISIEENSLRFLVDIQNGHKTGFYLDQRVNRFVLRSLVKDKEVLDCFCYSGGFTCAAAAGGATAITAVDSSKEALELAQKNIAINGLLNQRIEFLEADAFQVLRYFRDSDRSFDVIVLDPPKFAYTQSQVEKAARGYKDINLLAFKLLRQGGVLVTFSCSGNVDERLFQKIVAGAALDAGVDARIIQRLHQSPDHPVALHFPESAYLKGFITLVL